MSIIEQELDEIGVIPDKVDEIRNKDGIFLYRIYKNNQSYVLKYFENTESTREIRYYDLLRQFGVATLVLYGQTQRSILMEDMLTSARWRLGTAEDVSNPGVTANLAQWYRRLHDASGMILNAETNWYSEYGLLTPENLQLVAEKTGTAEMPFWSALTDQFDRLWAIIQSLEPVVNYNDFYYTNMAVSRNGQEAIMFDYNCMGKGFRAADLRNVCYSMEPAAARAFLESYGPVPEYEYRVDDVVSVLSTLVMASKRPEIPDWADGAIRALKSGKLAADFHDLISD